MKKQIWEKEVIIVAELDAADVTDWITPLPIIFTAKYHHYIGLYKPLLQSYFRPFFPYPYDDQQLSLTLQPQGLLLAGTEIVSHLFALYRPQNKQPLKIQCKVRQSDPILKLDLRRYFKQDLKASTCIRYGKFGASVITVDMSVHNIDDMLNNFLNCKFDKYMGELEPESSNLGYRFIVGNKEKIEEVPVRVVGKEWRVERSVGRKTTLQQFWRELGAGAEEWPCLLGVRVRNLAVQIQKLQTYCHPDGFLYLTF